MLLIDRYLIRQFLASLAICFSSLTGLFIIITTFGSLDEFISEGDHSGGGILKVLAEFYAYQTLAFFDATAGILGLIAAMFTIAGFQRHNELTALMAAGITRWRIVRPVVISVLVVIALATINREVVMPQFRDKLGRSTKDLSGENAIKLEPRRDRVYQIFLNGQETIAKNKQITNPAFELLDPELAKYGPQVVAENAFYLKATENHPSGYLFQNVEYPVDLANLPSIQLNDKPVLITPYDAPWLKENECFVASGVNFDLLTGGAAWRQYASTLELRQGLTNSSLDFGADIRVQIHSRIVQPLLDITLLFLGLPLILSQQSRNVFMAIGLAVGVVIAFMLVTQGFQYLGRQSFLAPDIAAWAPLLIFAPAAVGISEPLRQ